MSVPRLATASDFQEIASSLDAFLKKASTKPLSSWTPSTSQASASTEDIATTEVVKSPSLFSPTMSSAMNDSESTPIHDSSSPTSAGRPEPFISPARNGHAKPAALSPASVEEHGLFTLSSWKTHVPSHARTFSPEAEPKLDLFPFINRRETLESKFDGLSSSASAEQSKLFVISGDTGGNNEIQALTRVPESEKGGPVWGSKVEKDPGARQRMSTMQRTSQDLSNQLRLSHSLPEVTTSHQQIGIRRNGKVEEIRNTTVDATGSKWARVKNRDESRAVPKAATAARQTVISEFKPAGISISASFIRSTSDLPSRQDHHGGADIMPNMPVSVENPKSTLGRLGLTVYVTPKQLTEEEKMALIEVGRTISMQEVSGTPLVRYDRSASEPEMIHNEVERRQKWALDGCAYAKSKICYQREFLMSFNHHRAAPHGLVEIPGILQEESINARAQRTSGTHLQSFNLAPLHVSGQLPHYNESNNIQERMSQGGMDESPSVDLKKTRSRCSSGTASGGLSGRFFAFHKIRGRPVHPQEYSLMRT